jgi:pimeloyl-ACP methyl ester carboxylesterase
METVTSADGSTIAYDLIGDGSPIILLAGALCTRATTRPLADELGAHVRVINPDRRGRGDSTDASGDPWALEREIEDVAALIEATGGSASLYGHSSGAGLALQCAAAGLPVDRLVMHDAPYNVDAESAPGSQAYLAELVTLLRDGRDVDAVALFLGGFGMPEDVARASAEQLQSVAPSLAYDSAAMGDAVGGLVPLSVLPSVTVPTMVLAGGADHAFMIDIGRTLVSELPDATFVHLEGQSHDAPAEVVAPPILEFLDS